MTEGILSKLKFDNLSKERIIKLIKYHDVPLTAENKAVKRLLSKHGIDVLRQFVELHRADTLSQAGEILQNSVRINEMNPSKVTASWSYALIGAARAENGQMYIVRSVVNQFSNELASIDVLYAINAKTDVDGIKNRTSWETIPKVHGHRTASFLVLRLE